MKRLTYWNQEYDCWSYSGPSGEAAKRLAAYEDTGLGPEEIKALLTPPNPPLTLEELREMDGEPVYLDLGDGGEWALVRIKQGKVFTTLKNTICAPVGIALECGAKIYRRKPEEGMT